LLDSSAGADRLGRLTSVGLGLWERIEKLGTFGPVFSIRPSADDYPRPLPPRHSTLWMLGDAAYFVSHRYHEISPIGDPGGAARLRSSRLPEGVLRDLVGDLTLIRCRGPAEDALALAKQRYALEHWMSSLLGLPRHPDFLENGDERIRVLGKESVTPFTFYDQMQALAFKAVPETDASNLDDGTRRELAGILRTRTLADGRKIRRTMVIFPTREAAVHNFDVVSELGAAAAVYVGEDGHLWNPRAAGNWIRDNSH
jgi:hypothetical protein